MNASKKENPTNKITDEKISVEQLAQNLAGFAIDRPALGALMAALPRENFASVSLPSPTRLQSLRYVARTSETGS